MSTILEVAGISKTFGSLKVIDGFDFELAEGEALGIIGPNGAGKSTLFNLITGSLQPNSGSIRFEGADITQIPAYRRCRLGIGRSYQIPHPFGGMTVFENLLVGAAFGKNQTEVQSYDACARILDLTGFLENSKGLPVKLTLL